MACTTVNGGVLSLLNLVDVMVIEVNLKTSVPPSPLRRHWAWESQRVCAHGTGARSKPVEWSEMWCFPLGMTPALYELMNTLTHVRIALLLATALTIALPTRGVRAQAALTPSYVEDSPELRDTAPLATDSDSVRLRSLAELEARDATLSHRLRGYGVGLAGSVVVTAAGFALVARSLCFFFCTDQENRRGAAGSALVVLGASGTLVSTIGLITAGTRRRRGRQHIAALTLTPMVSLSPVEAIGGASLQLVW